MAKQARRSSPSTPEIHLLTSPGWQDYELLDSGNGRKLERYGPYLFDRPEHQAVWKTALSPERWEEADGAFIASGEESGGRWQLRRPVKSPWNMRYKGLVFQAHAANSRHMGVFPEQASHWDWIGAKIQDAGRPVRVLNLFGYTGLATLAAAQAGAQVTHVDASKNALSIARHNQELSGLSDRPVRWLVDDAYKFALREKRRNSQYDAFILDPPKFGRGPSGQIWEFYDSLPKLLEMCRQLASQQPLFVVLTAYAIRASALSISYALSEMVSGWGGQETAGELTLLESSASRLLSCALFARWSAIPD